MPPKKTFLIAALITLFFLTRLYILSVRPEFSVVSHYYKIYTQEWDQGHTPYLDIPYEYGPATGPLFYVPHLLVKAGVGEYYLIYRAFLLIFDLVLFAVILYFGRKKLSPKTQLINIFFFILTTTALKYFYFDSYDLVFAGVWFFALVVGLLSTGIGGRFFSWVLFWLAVALKFINAPLAMIKLCSRRWSIKSVIISVLAFLIIWAIPLTIFRSSLATVFFLHSARGLQVESVPANISRLINSFTHTESYGEVANAIEIIGPISSQISHIYGWLFPLGLLVWLIIATRQVWRRPARPWPAELRLTLSYIFAFMFLGKILSTPYLIWPLPFLAIYPFSRRSHQLAIWSLWLLTVISSALPVTNYQLGIFEFHNLIGLFRGLVIALLTIYFLIDTQPSSPGGRLPQPSSEALAGWLTKPPPKWAKNQKALWTSPKLSKDLLRGNPKALFDNGYHRDRP